MKKSKINTAFDFAIRDVQLAKNCIQFEKFDSSITTQRLMAALKS